MGQRSYIDGIGCHLSKNDIYIGYFIKQGYTSPISQGSSSTTLLTQKTLSVAEPAILQHRKAKRLSLL